MTVKKIRWFFHHIEEIMLVICLAYISVCMVLQVFMRRVMNNSLSWSEESIRYAFIWMMFLGLGIGVRDNKHIKIEALNNLMSKKGKKIIETISDIIFLGYSCYILYYSIVVVKSFFEMHQHSAALGIPMFVVYLAAPVGFGLLVIRLIKKIINDVTMDVK